MNENMARKVCDVIAKHGRAMSDDQYRRVTDIWDRVVIKGGAIGSDFDLLKSELEGLNKNAAPPNKPIQAPLRKAFMPQPMTGHQMAARRAGLPIDTPGLENMTFDNMKELSRERLLKAVAPTMEKNGIFWDESSGTYFHRW